MKHFVPLSFKFGAKPGSPTQGNLLPCKKSCLRSSQKNQEKESDAGRGSVTFDLMHAQFENLRWLAESLWKMKANEN